MLKKNYLKNISIVLAIAVMFLIFWLLSDSESKRLTKSEARIMAKNYKNLEKKTFTFWENTTIKNTTPIYSSNGIVIAYESSIFDNKDNPRGFIMINTSKYERVVPTFSDTWMSRNQYLTDYYRTTLKETFKKRGLTPTEFRVLGRMPMCFVVGVKFDEKNIEEKDFISEDGWYIFSEHSECKKKIYHANKNQGIIRKFYESISGSKKERDEFRKDLLENNTNSKFFIEASSGRSIH